METWKAIPGYENYYEAFTLGRIKRLSSGRILKSDVHDRYNRVSLCVNNKKKTYTVHELIALTFIGTRPQELHISHKDNVEKNNQLSNLEYVPVEVNIRHMINCNRGPFQKLTVDDVINIKAKLTIGVKIIEIANQFKVSSTTISKIKSGQQWKWI